MLDARIAKALNIKPVQAAATLSLLDDGNTVPFIARYRKEATGDLDEVQIRDVESQAQRIRTLESRRAVILASILEQCKLTAELKSAILAAADTTSLEDLYAPFRQKRQTRATRAISAGLEPLARAIRADEDVWDLAKGLTSKEYPNAKDAVAGAQDILAEQAANSQKARQSVRHALRTHGLLASKKRRGAELDPNFEGYYDFSSPVGRIRPHQVLAIRRAENEKAISASVQVDDDRTVQALDRLLNDARRNRNLVHAAIEDGYKRLLKPSVERDIRADLDEDADKHAIDVFALNLTNLLMQAPLTHHRVLAIDPGYRSGCKIAIIDGEGAFVAIDICYVHDGRKAQAPSVIRKLMLKHEVDVIAIGNGTASRETQAAAAEAVEGTDVRYAMVDEAGASVYSASDVARQEFPDMDISYRGAVSIGRRLQDPLAELVKIDPRSIGVGMYQHDVDQKRLERAVEAVVVDAVNRVGVELSTASASLLSYVSGIGPKVAGNIVAHRQVHGFKKRSDLKKVKGLGARSFEQCAGFLRIRDGREPLDSTAIHPESYVCAQAILDAADTPLGDPKLEDRIGRMHASSLLDEIATRHGLGKFTFGDLVSELVRPGRDPRGEIPPPELQAKQLTMDDLKEGMKLTGTVRNVVDFGAFVDLGVKQAGLVHVSQMADRFVKNPHDIVAVGDRVEVTIVSIDEKRDRIGLSML